MGGGNVGYSESTSFTFVTTSYFTCLYSSSFFSIFRSALCYVLHSRAIVIMQVSVVCPLPIWK